MADMRRDVERERGMIDKCLRDMVDRAEDFLSEHVTLANYQEMWDSQVCLRPSLPSSLPPFLPPSLPPFFSLLSSSLPPSLLSSLPPALHQAFAKRFQRQVVGNLATVVDEILLDISELVAQRARTQVCPPLPPSLPLSLPPSCHSHSCAQRIRTQVYPPSLPSSLPPSPPPFLLLLLIVFFFQLFHTLESCRARLLGTTARGATWSDGGECDRDALRGD